MTIDGYIANMPSLFYKIFIIFSLQNQNSNPIYTDTYSIEANTRYEVSVMENIAYIKGVSNAS